MYARYMNVNIPPHPTLPNPHIQKVARLHARFSTRWHKHLWFYDAFCTTKIKISPWWKPHFLIIVGRWKIRRDMYEKDEIMFAHTPGPSILQKSLTIYAVLIRSQVHKKSNSSWPAVQVWRWLRGTAPPKHFSQGKALKQSQRQVGNVGSGRSSSPNILHLTSQWMLPRSHPVIAIIR